MTACDSPRMACIEDLPAESLLAQRFAALKRKFNQRFGENPELYLRVPGRVNLIGEHIDYCGYSVCPMALQQDILLAGKKHTSGNFLELTNTDSDSYPDLTIPHIPFTIDFNRQKWGSYYLCGVKGALEEVLSNKGLHMRIAVSGNIPPGSGLSSSSALVCAAFLATTALHGEEVPKNEVALLCARSEQYIGTIGGGMDQAIAILATKGCAKHIEFSPFKTQDVRLPDEAIFVVAHSLVEKNKAASSDYNTRVVECRLAAQILAKRQQLNWKAVRMLADVHNALNVSIGKMSILVRETFKDEVYSKQQICHELGVSKDELNALTLTENTKHVTEFKLRQRALHVFEEAKRVRDWCKGCKEQWSLSELGNLMTESHKSLKDLYECSHEAVDALVDVALSCGALGARLTGAGWGGCIVAMTTRREASEFIENVKLKFYGEKNGSDANAWIFATQPNQGAELFSTVTCN